MRERGKGDGVFSCLPLLTREEEERGKGMEAAIAPRIFLSERETKPQRKKKREGAPWRD